MTKPGKLAKSEKILLLATVVFCILLTGLYYRDREGKHLGSYTITTQQSAPQEELVPEKVRININTASAEELDTLPGIGEALAERIITYRQEKGPFETPEDLKKVSGIGDAKYEELKNQITVDEEVRK